MAMHRTRRTARPVERFARALIEATRPDPRLGIAEWSEKHRRLPQSAPEPGPWRNDRTPYLIGIMDALSGLPSKVTRYAHDDERPFVNRWVRIVGMQKGHQLGGSALGENFVGRAISMAGGNIMGVFATVEDAQKWELDRFQPMWELSSILRRKIRPAGQKESDNRKLRKKFPGGMMYLVSAQRAGRLKSTSVRYVLLEEVDEYSLNVNDQGNPIDLAEKRTSNFGRRAKIFANSTPTIAGHSQIERIFLAGDQRRYFVHCPDCAHPQYFRWAQMKWRNGDPDTVLYHCEQCGAGNPEHVWKTRGYAHAYWMPTAPGNGKTASFHLPSLYAPIGWRAWPQMVRDWIEAQGDNAKLVAFANNELAQTWHEKTTEIRWETLRRRAQPYALRTIPPGCLILTAAVDTQNDRLEVFVDGWGRGMTNWTIDHVVIHGDPALPDVWKRLDEIRETALTNTFGSPLRIELMAIDSGGHRAQDVYDYCRLRRHLGVFAIKGAKDRHKPVIGRPTAQDVKTSGTTHKGGVMLWPVGTDTAKARIFANLLADEDAAPDAQRIRFPQGLDDEYYRQLLAETYNPKKDLWEKIRPRNEVLDGKVYNLACAYHPKLRLHLYRESDWTLLESMVEPRTRNLFAAADDAHEDKNAVPVPDEENTATAGPPAHSAPPRQSWLGVGPGWLSR